MIFRAFVIAIAISATETNMLKILHFACDYFWQRHGDVAASLTLSTFYLSRSSPRQQLH